MAAELIEQKLDVIVTVGTPAARIVRSATTTIPIVAHDLDTDPVISGLIASLARPGGNLTGFLFWILRISNEMGRGFERDYSKSH